MFFSDVFHVLQNNRGTQKKKDKKSTEKDKESR